MFLQHRDNYHEIELEYSPHLRCFNIYVYSKFYHAFSLLIIKKMDINSKPARSRFSNFHQVLRGLGSFFSFLFVCPGRDTISPRFQGRPRFRALISARVPGIKRKGTV